LRLVQDSPLLGEVRSLCLGIFLRSRPQHLFIFDSFVRDPQILLQRVGLPFQLSNGPIQTSGTPF
jgi:hypothetical protein